MEENVDNIDAQLKRMKVLRDEAATHLKEVQCRRFNIEAAAAERARAAAEAEAAEARKEKEMQRLAEGKESDGYLLIFT